MTVFSNKRPTREELLASVSKWDEAKPYTPIRLQGDSGEVARADAWRKSLMVGPKSPWQHNSTAGRNLPPWRGSWVEESPRFTGPLIEGDQTFRSPFTAKEFDAWKPASPNMIHADHLDFLRSVSGRRLSAGATTEPTSIGTIRSNMTGLFSALIGDDLTAYNDIERARKIAEMDVTNLKPSERGKLLIEALNITQKFDKLTPQDIQYKDSFKDQAEFILQSIYGSEAYRGPGGLRDRRNGATWMMDFLDEEFTEAAKLTGFWSKPEDGNNRMAGLLSNVLDDAFQANPNGDLGQIMSNVGGTLRRSRQDTLKTLGQFLIDGASTPDATLKQIRSNSEVFAGVFNNRLDYPFQHDTRFNDRLNSEIATQIAHQQGYAQMAIKAMTERAPDKLNELQALIGADGVSNLLAGKDVNLPPEAAKLLRQFLPGLTRQQGYDVVAAEAAGALRMSKRNPEEWLRRSLNSTSVDALAHKEASPWHKGVLREVEQAVASRRRFNTPYGQPVNLDPISLREEALTEVTRMRNTNTYAGEIAQHIALNQENREARWRLAMRNRTPVYIPGMGEAIVNKIDQLGAEGAQKLVAEVSRIHHDPSSVFVSASAEGWQAALDMMGKGRGGANRLTDLLHQVQTREHLMPKAQLVSPTGDQAGTLVRLAERNVALDFTRGETFYSVSDQLLRSWAPWFVPKDAKPSDLMEGFIPERLKTYAEGANTMVMAIGDVMQDQLVGSIDVGQFEELANSNYRSIMGRFYETMDSGGPTFDGLQAGVIGAVDRVTRAATKQGFDLGKGTILDEAIVGPLWEKARQENKRLANISQGDFMRAVNIISQGRHGVRSLDYTATDDAVSLAERVASMDPYTQPEEALLMKEAAATAGRGSRNAREAMKYFRELTKPGNDGRDPLSVAEALSGVMDLYDSEGVAHVLRQSKKARTAFGDVMSARGEINVSFLGNSTDDLDPLMAQDHAWDNLRTLTEAAEAAPGEFNFTVREGGRAVATGMPVIDEQNGIRIADRIFLNRDQITQSTARVVIEDNDVEFRERFGYSQRSSKTAPLAAAELPMVLTRSMDRNILSGRSYRAAVDVDATLINARAIANGAKPFAFDTEYFNVSQHEDLAHLTQLLQVSYAGDGHEVSANIVPSTELDAFVRGRVDLYKQVANDGVVRARDVAYALTQGHPDALVIQRERDIMTAMSFVAKLNPDADVRQLADGLYETEMIGRRSTIHGIKNISNFESLVTGALDELTATGHSEQTVLNKMAKHVGDGILVGVNASVADVPLIEAVARDLGSKPITHLARRPVVNLDVLGHFLYPEGINGVPSWSLESMVGLLEAHPVRAEYQSSAHTALTDVHATQSILDLMLADHGDEIGGIQLGQAGQMSFSTLGIRELNIPRGHFTVESMGESERGFRMKLEGIDELVVRGTGAEMKQKLAQRVNFFATAEEAATDFARMTEQQGNDELERAFRGGFYHLDRLVDAGSGGARRERTAELLGMLGEGHQPLEARAHRHLLSLSDDAVESMLTQTYNERKVAAGEFLVGDARSRRLAPGLQAIMDVYAEAEAIGRGLRHLPIKPDQKSELVSGMMEELIRGIKEEAGLRTAQGRRSLGQLELDKGTAGLYIDNYPVRSMWDNVQRVSEEIDLPTETMRKHEATKRIHSFLVEQGVVTPLQEGQSPSVETMAMAVDRLGFGTPTEQTNYTGFAASLRNMSAEEAAGPRERLIGRINATPAAQAVDADPMARQQAAVFGEAIDWTSRAGARVPLPFNVTLPLNGELIHDRSDVPFGAGLVSAIESTSGQLRQMEIRRMALARAMENRPGLAEEYRTIGQTMKANRQQLSDMLRTARDRASDPALTDLLGLSNPGEETMVLMGGQQYHGRRIGDLTVAEMDGAIAAVENSPVRNAELRDKVAGALRSINEQIKDKGAAGYAPVREVLHAPPPMIGTPVLRPGVVPPAESPASIVRDLGHQLAEEYDAQPLAREAIQNGGLSAAAHNVVADAVQVGAQEAEYTVEKRIASAMHEMSGYMHPGYLAGALGAVAVIGAFTLGSRGGMSRPRANDSPAPDGNYEDGVSELATRPLSPEITMGNQAYVEPNGAGMTVRVRTKGAHDPGQITAMVQDAMAGHGGQMHVTVRDNRDKLNGAWLSDAVKAML